MAELARTPPVYRRRFRMVDLVPRPQNLAVVMGLDAWRGRCGSDLAPRAVDMVIDEPPIVKEHSFQAEPVAGKADYFLGSVGNWARAVHDPDRTSGRLSAIAFRRLAVRLRRLFELVTDCGEPVVVQFIEDDESFESLAAPLLDEAGRSILFCTMGIEQLPAVISPDHRLADSA